MNKYKQQVIDFFDRRTNYDREGTRHPCEAKRLLESVPIQPGQKILDLATGTGLVAIAAAQQVGDEGSVVGVDLSSGMLQQARQKIIGLGLKNLELIQADVELINFAQESFDVIFCCSAITYLSNLPQALYNCHQWLKPQGYLAFTCPAETAYLAAIQIKVCKSVLGSFLPHINEPLGSPEKCHKMLQQAGLRDIKLEIEVSGEYLPLNHVWVDWSGNGFYPRGNPLANLSTEQLAKLKTEYRLEIEKLRTKQGIWYDRTTFFVQARK
ncbi:Methyltransferase type 11 [Stanieria sp. NIES-3757]|nr:Methyltransferase type 11 [Stanieria sp. NIES-3757]